MVPRALCDLSNALDLSGLSLPIRRIPAPSSFGPTSAPLQKQHADPPPHFIDCETEAQKEQVPALSHRAGQSESWDPSWGAEERRLQPTTLGSGVFWEVGASIAREVGHPSSVAPPIHHPPSILSPRSPELPGLGRGGLGERMWTALPAWFLPLRASLSVLSPFSSRVSASLSLPLSPCVGLSISVALCVSVSLTLFVCVSLSLRFSLFLPFSVFWSLRPLAVFSSLCLCVSPHLCLSISVSLCLSLFELLYLCVSQYLSLRRWCCALAFLSLLFR